ncbi:MAG: DUF2786 domain-containing protein [Halanaerobiales bacterium]
MDREKILEKIQKLLNMADDAGEHEAQAAMLRAQKLMAKHKIDMKEVEDADLSDVVDVFVFDNDKRHRNWKYILGMIIAENFSCKVFKRTRLGESNMKVIGREDDVKIFQSIFEYADNYIEEKSLRYAKRRQAFDGTKVAPIRNEWIIGFIDGLKRKFEEQKQNMEEETAIVLKADPEVIEKLKDYNLRKGSAFRMNTAGDGKAYNTGHREGKSMNFGKAIKA